MINPDLVAQRDHPGSKLGKPGALQGINTGVNLKLFSLQILKFLNHVKASSESGHCQLSSLVCMIMFTLEFDHVKGCSFLAGPNEMESSF